MKQERENQTKQRKQALNNYRHIQSLLAANRDGGLCVFHYFLKGQKVQKQDIHHCFGRGDQAGDWREHYTSLLSTCRECHPLPMQDLGSKQNWVIEVMDKANKTPINPDYKHQINYEEVKLKWRL